MFAYRYHEITKTAEQQSQLLIETREKAEKELQSLRDKLAAEERARQVAEKDAKAPAIAGLPHRIVRENELSER